MKLSYSQFVELCNPDIRVFTFGYLADNTILWYVYVSPYGYIWSQTDCMWSYRGYNIRYEELKPHIIKIYIEKEFRGEIWEVESEG